MKRRVTALLLLLALACMLAVPATALEFWEEEIYEGTVLVKYSLAEEELIVRPGTTEIREVDSTNWLERVVLPDSLRIIGKRAFSNTQKLIEINLPEGLETIGDNAFTGSHLDQVVIPSTVTSVGKEAFKNTQAKSIRFQPSANGITIGEGALSWNWARELVLPVGLKEIPKSMAEGSKITTIVIPEGVTTIGADAFKKCETLTNVTIPASVTSIGAEAFEGTPWLEARGGELVCGTTLVSGKVVDGKAVIPEGITTIGPRAFYNNKELVEANIPDSVKVIGAEAFSVCSNMTDLTLPGSLDEIGKQAFSGCVGLTQLVIPPTGKIGVGAFQVCKGLTDVVMLDGTKRISEQMFSSCESLARITLPGDVTEIFDSAFGSCREIESLYLPDSITTIGKFALAGKFTSLTLPARLTNVGSYPVAGCSALTTIYYTVDSTPYASFLSPTKGVEYVYTKLPEGANAPAVLTAYASTQAILVDGKEVTFQAYALKDAAGNATNYVKLRDLAGVLTGTPAQFDVGWDGSVTIRSKTAYSPNGTELTTPYSGDKPYQVNTAPIKLDGKAADLNGIVLTHGSGGYTYFKLRDLGAALDFNVRWNGTAIEIESGKPYTGV